MRGVFYTDETMQVADEGTVPQKYTYADDKLIWSYTDEQGEHLSTFVRLTAEERAAYEALGVGSVAEGGDGNNNRRILRLPDFSQNHRGNCYLMFEAESFFIMLLFLALLYPWWVLFFQNRNFSAWDAVCRGIYATFHLTASL